VESKSAYHRALGVDDEAGAIPRLDRNSAVILACLGFDLDRLVDHNVFGVDAGSDENSGAGLHFPNCSLSVVYCPPPTLETRIVDVGIAFLGGVGRAAKQ